MRSIDQIIRFLRRRTPSLRKKQILAGFDGFIDTIVKPVRRFNADGNCEFFHTIGEFGAFTIEHSHKSTSIQYKTLEKKPGGNMPNFIMALDALSLSPVAVGMLSNENGTIDPLFENLGKQRYSYLPAGAAMAFEFEDGKIFFSSAATPGVRRDEKIFLRVENAFSEFSAAVACADLMAMLNWSELPFAQDLWNDVYVHGLSLEKKDKSRFVFFDLCDTSAKNRSEIEALLSLIGKIGEHRGTILSLNKNEALNIGGKIGGAYSSMAEIAKSFCRRFAIDELVIHQHTESIAVSAGGDMVTEPCVLNKNPKISTGAGDHFNAAYCFATLAGLPLVEKLRFANTYSGAYIARGASPCLQDIENP